MTRFYMGDRVLFFGLNSCEQFRGTILEFEEMIGGIKVIDRTYDSNGAMAKIVADGADQLSELDYRPIRDLELNGDAVDNFGYLIFCKVCGGRDPDLCMCHEFQPDRTWEV